MGVKGRVSRWARDAGERVFWTFVAVGLGGVTVEALDLPAWAVVPVSTALTALKAYAARRVGDPSSAAMRKGV